MAGLRERKAAMLKVNLAEDLMSRLVNHHYDQIKVTDLCEKIAISKVTFFKYFHSKDDLLRYCFRIWCMKVCVELSNQPKKGTDGIYYVFEKVIHTLKTNPYFFHAYYSSLVADHRVKAPFPLKKVERNLLLKESDQDVEIKSVHQLIDNFSLEAVFNKQINTSDHTRFSEFIYTYMLGVITSSSIRNIAPENFAVKRELQELISKY